MTATPVRRRYTPSRTLEDDKPSRVAIYLRISLDNGPARGEVGGLGIARQREACLAEVERRGWTVDPADIYEENDTSASSTKPRPKYEALLRRVERGEVDTIVCWATDRLLRKNLEMEHLIELVEWGPRLRVVTCQGELNLESPEGRTSARILATIARQEADAKGYRQHAAEVQAVERGKPPRTRAFGYRPGGMEVDPVEGPAVADGYRMLMAGSTLAHIARTWNDRGLTTTKGRPWEPTAVRAVLMSCRYAAIRSYYGEESGPGIWPPIIPEADYRKALALLNDPKRRAGDGDTARRWLGASLYRCGQCAAEGRDAVVRTGYKNGPDHERVYVCPDYHRTRLADAVDSFVVGVVEARLGCPDAANLAAAENPHLAELQTEAEAIRARVRRLEADYADGMISARILKEQTARQQTELDRIERHVAAETRTSRLAAIVGAADPVAAWRRLDAPARQAVVDALMTVTVHPVRMPRGGRDFDLASVTFEWKGGASA